MARKSETVEMYGYKFNIVKFDVLTSSAVLANLISVYGPIFGSIIGGFLSDATFGNTEDMDREPSANDGFMYHDRWDKLERITPPHIIYHEHRRCQSNQQYLYHIFE